MSKVTLNNIASLKDATAALTAINANTSAVQTALDNTISRNGTAPNEMQATLDMNSNRIINLPAGVSASEPARKGDLDTLVAAVDAEIVALQQVNISSLSQYPPEVYTIADATNVVLGAINDRMRLTLPHGSMILKKQVSVPAHKAYIHNVNGGYYVWESGVLVPELCGVVATNGVDNTQAFKDFATAINALAPSQIRFAKGATYDVCSTDATCLSVLGNQGTMMQLTDLTNFVFDCNGATLRTRFATGTYQPNIWGFTRCTHWKLLNPKGTQDKVIPVPWVADDFLNTYWINVQDGCTDFDVDSMNFFGGTIGFSAIYIVHSAQARVARGRVSGYCSSVFYPYSLQNTGDSMTLDIETYNAARSIIAYGYRGVRGRIRSTPSNLVQDIAIEGDGMEVITAGDNPVSEDIELEYISTSQLGSGGPVAALVLHSRYEDGANHFCMLKGVKLHLDIQNSNAGFTSLVTTGSLKDDSGGGVSGGDVAGNRIYGLVIDGNLRADLNGSGNYMFSFGNNALDGFTTNTLVEVAIKDFFAFDCTRDVLIGKYASAQISNFNSPGSTITQEAASVPSNLSIVHSRSAGVGSGARYSKLTLV